MERRRFMESLGTFSKQIVAARERMTLLHESESSLDLLEELMTALEELHTAEEEMLQQHETLIQSELELQLAHQHYRDLFESAPLGYLVTDAHGAIQEANQAAAILLNINSENVIGKPLAIYVPQHERPHFRATLLSFFEQDDNQKWEMHLQPRNKPPVPVAVTCTKVEEENYGSSGVRLRWLLYDLTERELAQKAEREKVFQSTFEQSPVGMAYLTPDGKWSRVNQSLCDMLGYNPDELHKLTFLDITHPDDIGKSRHAHQQLLEQKDERVSVEKRYFHKDGSLLWMEVTSSLVINTNKKPEYIISVLEDITERKQIEAAEREQRLLAEGLHHTAIKLTSTLNLDEVMDHLLSSLEQVVPHDAATVMLIEKQRVKVVRTQGYKKIGLNRLDAALSHLHVHVQHVDLLNEMARTKKPLLRSSWQVQGDFQDLPQIEQIHSLVSAPLISNDQILGFIHLHSKTDQFYNERYAQILEAFAAQAAIAIQNAQLYQRSRQLAVMEERQRLARDLHDAVSQTLFSSVLITETLPKLLVKDQSETLKHLKDLEVLNRSAMAEMRLLLLELRPEQLLKMSLRDQIIQMTEAVSGRKRIEFNLQIDPIETEQDIPIEVKIALFRIAQEALNNIVKHSVATQVRIQLTTDGKKITLEIQDNGQGFDLKSKSSGLGMSSMSERAKEIGASLKIQSRNGQGTLVTVTWVQIGNRAHT
jgi:PAS domain S-box-containing protein